MFFRTVTGHNMPQIAIIRVVLAVQCELFCFKQITCLSQSVHTVGVRVCLYENGFQLYFVVQWYIYSRLIRFNSEWE